MPAKKADDNMVLKNKRRLLTTCTTISRTKKIATNMALVLQWLQRM